MTLELLRCAPFSYRLVLTVAVCLALALEMTAFFSISDVVLAAILLTGGTVLKRELKGEDDDGGGGGGGGGGGRELFEVK